MSSALTETGPQPLPRRRQVQLLKALALEAGWRHLALLSGLSTLNSLLDIAGLGLAVTLLLGSGSSTDAAPLIGGLPTAASLGLVAITGPSGSGKTTLLDRICGLLREEDSHWQLSCDGGGWSLSGLAGARQMHQLIAYAPQNAVLFEANLRENLLLGANRHQDDIETWLQLLGLAHLLQRQGGLDAPLALAQDPFSGGEIHRFGLLRAWLRDKPMEVLDEPTAFLDAKAAEQVR
ncbi:ATP-binding cassette domain-containing protein [Synechococcus sp. N19]|uniref:ATP-binding cassette domain-containing protein n=1 Tax=Synechococcus sp. N19 TaxID=2575512 RepID=UPI001FCC887E|nr:ATP-binding cassette domain-containing protein [Synechococcus sp. N19]